MTTLQACSLAKNYFKHNNIECDGDPILETKVGNIFIFWNPNNPNYYCKIEVNNNNTYLDLYNHVSCSWIEL